MTESNARVSTEENANEDVTARVPHLEVLRFYETEVRKVALRGVGWMDYVFAIIAGLASCAAFVAAEMDHQVLALVALAMVVVMAFALRRRMLTNRGVAHEEFLPTWNDLTRAIVAGQVTEMEGFLSKHGWLSETALSHLCEVFQSRRADHREGRAWLGRWLVTCVGFVMSAMVGAASGSISSGEKAFGRVMATVGLLLVLVTLLLFIVGNLLQMSDRRSSRLGGLVELLRVVQVRLKKR